MTKIAAASLILFSLILCNCSEDNDSGPEALVQVVSFGLDPDHPPLRSQKEGFDSSGMTAVTVHAGDRIEVRPKSLIRHERVMPAPVSSRTSETVCTKPVQICVLSVPITEQRCHQKCKLCQDCNIFGCYPSTCCADVCENVTVGSRCLATVTRCDAQEVHWKDQTVYAELGNAVSKEDAEPMKSVEMLLQGIRLKLENPNSVGGTEGPECALAQFKPAVEAGKLLYLGKCRGLPGPISGERARGRQDSRTC